MDGNIEDRLARLENKMRINFFEIEKKLVKLETSSPAAMDERVQELEDLLLLLQLENIQIKERASSTDTTQHSFGEEINNMELSREIPSDVMERLNYIEDKISSLKECKDESVEKRLDEMDGRLSAFGKIYKEVSDIELRLNDFEKRASFKGSAPEESDVKERLSNLEKTVSLRKTASEDIENRLYELNKGILEEMDNRLLETNNKINRIEVPSNRELVLKGMEDRMDEMEKNVSLAVEESENISKTFEKRLSLLERGSGIREVGLENIEKKLNNLERQLSLLGRDTDKIDFFSKEISEIDKRLNLLELRERPEKGKVLSEIEKILGGRDGEKNPGY